MKVSELTILTDLGPDDEVLVVRGDYGPGLASVSSGGSGGGSSYVITGGPNEADITVSTPVEDGVETHASSTITNDEVVKRALLKAWPVGSYYKGEDDPNESIGGTWTEIFGRMLFAFDTGSAGQTGGSESVIINSNYLPSHTHDQGSISVSNYHTHTAGTLSHTHTVTAHTHTCTIPSSHTHTTTQHRHTIPTHRHSMFGWSSIKSERSDLGARSGDGGFKGRLFTLQGGVGYPLSTGQSVNVRSDTAIENVSELYGTVNNLGTMKTDSYTNTAGVTTGSATPSGSFNTTSDLGSFSTYTWGGGFGHENMPPNTLCRIWRRDA